jgi:hypothetical protein
MGRPDVCCVYDADFGVCRWARNRTFQLTRIPHPDHGIIGWRFCLVRLLGTAAGARHSFFGGNRLRIFRRLLTSGSLAVAPEPA